MWPVRRRFRHNIDALSHVLAYPVGNKLKAIPDIINFLEIHNLLDPLKLSLQRAAVGLAHPLTASLR